METKSSRILDIIAKSPGMSFTDIQRALWEMNHPKGTFTRKQRGYWCDNLLGCRAFFLGAKVCCDVFV